MSAHSSVPGAPSPGELEAVPPPPPRGLKRWWRIMDASVGIIPVPVYLVLVVLMIVFSLLGQVRGELAFVIVISTLFAFTLGEIGNRVPGLRQIGGGAILVTFVPSLAVYLGWIPEPMTTAVSDFFDSSKILNLFIAAVIVGSILSMDRSILIKGFVKIFVPLICGTALALGLGLGSGLLLGLGLHDTFFYTVVPIMAGGVGEGAVPLTLGYSQAGGGNQGELLALVLPSIMVANLTAVLSAGVLTLVGRKVPRWTGNGRLAPERIDLTADPHARFQGQDLLKAAVAAGLVAVSLYLLGVLANDVLRWPAPVVMLFLAVLLTLAHLVSPRIRAGAKVVYQLAISVMAFPVLFTFSLTLTPWESLVKGFAPAHLITTVLTVVGMILGGFLSARLVRLFPVETAMVTATHSGMGGAGDIAILTAGGRLELMPFAQIATRIGGGITVAIALVLFAAFGS